MLTMAAAASAFAISREVLQTAFATTRLSSIIPSTASRPWSGNTLSYNNCRRRCPVEVRIGVAYDAVTKEREELMDEIHRRMDRIKENPIGAPFTEEDVLAALDDPEFNTSENFDERYSVKGKIFYTDPDGAMVDINAKAPAFLPVRECSMYNILMPGQAGIRPGLEEEFAIIGEDKKGISLVLSLREVQKSLAWERCRQLQVEDVTVKAKVLSANKGGLMVILESLEGFIPFSQVATTTQLEDLVNKELPVKIVDTNEEEGRLVLSNRKAVVENQAQLELGTVVLGTVQSIKPYGAFIDLGTISGLLHVSQISHDRVTDVGAILQPGDTLKVMVMSHDRERGRVSLSTKKLEPTPGDMLRNPKLVYEKAEEMAETFKNRVAQAYALARSQSAFSSTVGGGFNLDLDGVIDSASKQNSRLSIEDLDSSAQDDSQ